MPDTVEDKNERLLVQRAGTDPAAFQVLYELYFKRVYGYVVVKVNNRQDAEDIVSDIFLQIVKGLPQFRNNHHLSFATWLFTITRNNITNFYRRQGRNPNEVDLESIETTLAISSELDNALIQSERAAELRLMLLALSERRREVIMLKYFGGLRNLEIAQILGLDERTVSSHLSRGLKDLYEAYIKLDRQRHSL